MKGSLPIKWGLLPLLLFIALPAFAQLHTILIVKSSDNRFFSRSIETLINHTQAQLKYRITTLEQLKKQPALQKNIDIIITMGNRAADYTSEVFANLPVVHSYITKQQHVDHPENKQHYSILLNQPLSRYVHFIKLLLNVQSIGLLHSHKLAVSQKVLDLLERKFDLHIRQSLLAEDDNPISAARDLLQSIDVLLALPDPAIYNRRSLKGILLTSYRQKKPLVSYSPAQVKSGALAAIFSTPENIGQQVAELINVLLKSQSLPPASFYYAKYFDIKINRRIAESLELDIASKEALLDLLQQQD